MTTPKLKQTILRHQHTEAGGRMVEFAGFEMPVQYESVLSETRAVREFAGMFDVSHMGRFWVEGPDARGLLNWVHTADINEPMPVGRARYGLVCNETGGIIDDAIIYRLADERFMIIANAANAADVFEWLEQWRLKSFPNAVLIDQTAAIAMIALQGPAAVRIASSVADSDVSVIRPFREIETSLFGSPAIIARTGYTGEDGVELMPRSDVAPQVWRALIAASAVPCGLGARDTLRLEAGLLLHGSDMDATVNPVEAGLERFVHFDKEFCGAEVIQSAYQHGTTRKLVGLQTEGRGPVPRAHAEILSGQAVVGQVTSGSYSPSLDTNIALGYVPTSLSAPQTPLQIDVRGRPVVAHVGTLPFYSRLR